MARTGISDLVIIAVRAVLLGFIVFSSITAIPAREISTHNKLVVSVVVVAVYALLDYFSGFFGMVRTFFCRVACNCSPNSSTDTVPTAGVGVNIDLGGFDVTPVSKLDTDTLSNEVEEAIRLLDTVSTSTEDEKAAKKATGIESQSPAPAETKEGFVNYGKW